MKVFSNIEAKSYEEESAAVRLLIAELRNNYQPQIDALNLREWIDELERVENEFDTVFKERNTEYAGKPDDSLQDVRKEIDGVYAQMTEIINANALLTQSPVYDNFIRELNEEIEYTLEHSHRHAKKDIGAGDHTVVEPVTEKFDCTLHRICRVIYQTQKR